MDKHPLSSFTYETFHYAGQGTPYFRIIQNGVKIEIPEWDLELLKMTIERIQARFRETPKNSDT